jgi:hypothetical protein
MTNDLMITILNELNIDYAYHHFKKPPEGDAYIAYFEDEKVRFLADDKVYGWEPSFAVELYTKNKDLTTESQLISLFDKYEVVWSGGESVWIDSEQIYQTVFYC